ncbi:MAG: DDE-type integrase/transposase/recombinase [Deltaproteobacteria bacterium]|nr:DDE-type integrase/transposase/recombinase [Deltaproteobacteria bacterium]
MWAADTTYIPIVCGFLCLVVVMDWVSHYVLAWRLSNLLDASFCIETLEEALSLRRPEIFNTDRAASSPTKTIWTCCAPMEWPSTWTAAATSATTSSSNDWGAASVQ